MARKGRRGHRRWLKGKRGRGTLRIEAIRRELRNQLIDHTDPVRLVDSAPITLMTYTRGAHCQSVDGNDDYFGVVTSKKGKFFGLRLQVTTTVNQLIDDWVIG